MSIYMIDCEHDVHKCDGRSINNIRLILINWYHWNNTSHNTKVILVVNIINKNVQYTINYINNNNNIPIATEHNNYLYEYHNFKCINIPTLIAG